MENPLQTETTAAAIRRLETLPPLSRQAQELLSALGDPELDTRQLVALLRQSPPLAARILGIARSAFFAGPLPPRDLEDAVIRFLGLALVRDLAIAFTLATPLQTSDCKAFQPLRYWRQALLTASLAEDLAAAMTRPGVEQAYLAGLLHNLGLLALVHVAPQPMQQILLTTSDDNEVPLSMLELQRLGMDHCLAGEYLAHAWELPPEIADVMTFHRDSRYRGRHWELVLLTALAERHCAGLLRPGAEPGPEQDLLRGRLDIEPGTWDRVIGGWQPKAMKITELAGQFR